MASGSLLWRRRFCVSRRPFTATTPVEAQTVLANVKQINWLLQRLVSDGQSVVAGRLAGAFRHVGMDSVADGIARTMRDAERFFREKDPVRGTTGRSAPTLLKAAFRPFTQRLSSQAQPNSDCPSFGSGCVSRFWRAFPRPPGRPEDDVDMRHYLQLVEDAYVEDAYHSLSIEGYRVTPELL